jgi:hypothetical protein
MRHDIASTTRFQLAGMLLLSFAVFAAFWIGEGLAEAWPPLLILLAVTAFIQLFRSRSGTVEVMGGIGDERTTALYTRAGSWTAGAMTLILPAWWLVTVALGDPNETLRLVCAISGVTWVVTSMLAARRG